MAVSFVSLQGNENTGWDVVMKTFPTISEGSVSLSVTTTTTALHRGVQKRAEEAARLWAETKQLPFVYENDDVITIAPLGENYVVCMLTSSDIVTGLGTASESIQSAIEKAKNEAKSRNLLFILP